MSTFAILLLAATLAEAQSPIGRAAPPALGTLIATAQLPGELAAWCHAEFRPGQRGAFAIAMTRKNGRGRYYALDSDGRASELASFAPAAADLSCYTRARAERLDRSLRQSETVEGRIRPRWNTTVICGFVEPTEAACWQYSPRERKFVEVGRWVT